MEKRFCSECGNEMGENEKFCRACGTPVGSADKKEETVGQKVDNSIEDVKNKIATKNKGSKLNIKVIAPIVAIIVIIFLAWAITSAYSGFDIELDGQTFHIGSKYYKNDTMAQNFANQISDYKPGNVVCYVDATGTGDYGGPDYFIIVTKQVGNLTLNEINSNGNIVNINGKDCIK